ncbi:MAG: hypothetical protein NW220_10280 [Leptolyngbyaceae cyanobacterium bins.349]|nr:hypothetical protein [Leptolyngbyaceae cyanobacterium bins.349]
MACIHPSSRFDHIMHIMKDVFAGLLTVCGFFSALPPAFGQVPEMLPGSGPTPSGTLIIEPLERSRSPQVGPDHATLNANQLSAVANSIRANPNLEPTNSLGGGIPKDLFRTPSQLLPDSHPLEVFQPPAPNRSFGVNLSGF